MDPQDLVSLARDLAAGRLAPEEFARQVSDRSEAASAGTARLATATVDVDRRRRCGFPEVVYGTGKSVDSLRQIVGALVDRGQPVLVTRVAPEPAAALGASFPAGRYNELARTFRVPGKGQGAGGREQGAEAPGSKRSSAPAGVEDDPARESAIRNPQSEIVAPPTVAVITAGTSDLPVAEEARETLDWMGVRVTMIHDVGVAGPHRLPARLGEFEHADAVVVVAGMEGALPSIVGGLVGCPVIGVPTSVGYGASFSGITALLSMLNSCASNVAVVNIDAGFKAGYLAGLIATRRRAAAIPAERR
jgi:NCAIR mutase (PurE)-related protein